MDTKTRTQLDLLLSSIDSLDRNLVVVDIAESGQIARQLRDANGKIWRLIHVLEAHNLQYLYELADVIRAISHERNTEDELVETVVSLINDGALRVNPKRLLDEARARNIDVDAYLTSKSEPEEV